MAERPVDDVLSAARYWRATQTVKGVPTQAIEHAHRCLVRAVEAYEVALKRAEEARHPAECECAPCWTRGNYAPGTGD